MRPTRSRPSARKCPRSARQREQLGDREVPEVDAVGDQAQPRERRRGQHPARQPAGAVAEHRRRHEQRVQDGAQRDRGQGLGDRLLGGERLRDAEQPARSQQRRERDERRAGAQPAQARGARRRCARRAGRRSPRATATLATASAIPSASHVHCPSRLVASRSETTLRAAATWTATPTTATRPARRARRAASSRRRAQPPHGERPQRQREIEGHLHAQRPRDRDARGDGVAGSRAAGTGSSATSRR